MLKLSAGRSAPMSNCRHVAALKREKILIQSTISTPVHAPGASATQLFLYYTYSLDTSPLAIQIAINDGVKEVPHLDLHS